MLKKTIALSTAFLIIFSGLSVTNQSNVTSYAETTKTVTTKLEKVKYSGGTATFTSIRVPLNDPKIQIVTTTAAKKIGQVDTLSNLVLQENDEMGKAIAGINGTFFNAYTDFQPAGTVIKQGQVGHISNTGSVIGLGAGGQLSIEPLDIKIEGSSQGQWVWPYNWYAWNLNHFYNDPKAVMIFDKQYGGVKPKHDFAAISVVKGVVTSIQVGAFNIPSEGFLVLTKDAEILKKLTLKTAADFRFVYGVKTYDAKKTITPYDASLIQFAVGAGPILVKSGQVVADPKKEGFTELKILTNKGQRSFIGVTQDKQLIFASVPSVTVKELAEIAKLLKCQEAINLDGGASSGTYANGKYVVTPGRKISNALVVKVLTELPIGINLNGKSVFLSLPPVYNQKDEQVYVPEKEWLNRLGFANKAQTLSSATTLKIKGVDYVAIKELIDDLMGKYEYNITTRRVEVVITLVSDILKEASALETQGQLPLAAARYKVALAKDTNNIIALKALANLYHLKLNEPLTAVPYYQKIIQLEPTNVSALSSLAWVLYAQTQLSDAKALFEKVVSLAPDSAAGYYGLALVLSHNQINDTSGAKANFEAVLKRSPTEQQKVICTEYINSH